MLQIKKGGIQQKLKLPTVKYCKHSLLSEDIINLLLKKEGEKKQLYNIANWPVVYIVHSLLALAQIREVFKLFM